MVFVSLAACGQPGNRIVGGGCDGCDLMFEGMPKVLASATRISSEDEPGEPMQISGMVYKNDGRTPAPGIIVYFYHTDAKGHYSQSANQVYAKRHGHLRGWIKTDAQGHYAFATIRPASYPNNRIPAHVHPVIKEPDKNEYYIDEYRFDDDPLLTDEERRKEEKRGGSGIIHLTKNEKGVWVGHRDIVLGYHIPNY